MMAGPSLDDLEGSATEQQIINGIQLTDTIVLNQSDIGRDIKVANEIVKKRNELQAEVQDSCDLGAEDALEGMVGGNFNTFGEHTSNIFNQPGRKSIDIVNDQHHQDDEPAPMLASSTKLIEQIEHQIE